MKKVISFSLYGNNPIYTMGCIKNAKLKRHFFKDWEIWVYYNNTVSDEILNELAKLNVVLINTNEDNGFFGSLWRFRPIIDPNIEYFISRDGDSRISLRDETAVEEWIKSGKNFHIIRDHPTGHGWPINAGMWGARGQSIPNFFELMISYLRNNNNPYDKTVDQCFLRDVVYPIASKNCFLHDEFFNYENTGTHIKRARELDDFAFIGESVDENDIPDADQRTCIKEKYNTKV